VAAKLWHSGGCHSGTAKLLNEIDVLFGLNCNFMLLEKLRFIVLFLQEFQGNNEKNLKR
jgi:hypothetical protein